MNGMEEVRENKRKFRINPFIWVIPLILSGVGILMITSTTSPNSFTLTGTPFQMGIKQAQWLLIALIGMFVVFCHTSAGLVQIERPHTDTDMDYVLVAPYSGGRYERRRGKPLDRCTRIICFDPAGRTALSCDRTASGKAALKVGQRSRKGVFINDNTCGDSCRSAFTAA